MNHLNITSLSRALLGLFFILPTLAWSSPRKCDDLLTDNIKSEVRLAMMVATMRPDAMSATQIMLDMMKVYPFVTFADFEEQLREIDSPMHLIAVPAGFAPLGLAPMMPTPEGKTIPKAFYLWVGIHGADEAKEMLEQHGLHEGATNLKNLCEDTGVLVRRPN